MHRHHWVLWPPPTGKTDKMSCPRTRQRQRGWQSYWQQRIECNTNYHHHCQSHQVKNWAENKYNIENRGRWRFLQSHWVLREQILQYLSDYLLIVIPLAEVWSWRLLVQKEHTVDSHLWRATLNHLQKICLFANFFTPHILLEAGILRSNATWHALTGICKATNTGAPFMFISNDWL